MSVNEDIEQQTQTSNPATPVIDKESEEKPKTPFNEGESKAQNPEENASKAEENVQTTTEAPIEGTLPQVQSEPNKTDEGEKAAEEPDVKKEDSTDNAIQSVKADDEEKPKPEDGSVVKGEESTTNAAEQPAATEATESDVKFANSTDTVTAEEKTEEAAPVNLEVSEKTLSGESVARVPPEVSDKTEEEVSTEGGVISAENLGSKEEIDFHDEDALPVDVANEDETKDDDDNEGKLAPTQSALEARSSEMVSQVISNAHSQLSGELSPEVPPPPPSLPEDSAIEDATAEETMSKPRSAGSYPINFEWTFGFNRRIPCLNLTDDSRSVALYASSHVTVLYDYKNNTQKLLQGHGNAVTCIACSEDKRWLVTGEKGPDSCVIAWDTYTGIPVQVIFDVPGDNGVIAVGMSCDAKYIVTVNAGDSQSVSVWDWTTSVQSPLHNVELGPLFQPQTFIRFHPYNSQLFVTNGESQIIFYCWETGSLEHHSPFLADTTFNKVVGTFSQTIFQAAIPTRTLTATSQGNIAVWDPDRPDKKRSSGGIVPSHRKRVLKLVRVMDRGITALSQTDDFVVAGNTQGHVTFFDEQLNLIISYIDLKIGAVNGISFKYDPDFDLEPPEKNNDYPLDSTIASRRFVVRDFIVSTKTSEIVHVQTSGTRVKKILWEHDAAVNALAACPNKPWICIGSYAGLLKLWDYEVKKVLVTRIFEGRAKIRSLAFSHNGLQIAVGMTSGTVHILDTMSLIIETTFHYAREAITHCAFSYDSKYLATADEECTTTVFTYTNNMIWKYLGRHKAHYKPIKDIVFGLDIDLNQPRLLTLGEDRMLVEYDLASSSKDDLKLLSVDRVEQSAIPLCLSWYPPVTKESFLLTINDQYKMKMYNTTTKMCRKTLLGPTYGSPAALMSVLPEAPDADPTVNRLLAYATSNKVGLQLLPLDGNPHRSTSCIAHPGGVAAIACGYDGNHFFTAGGRETTVHMWNINREALEAVAALGGDDLTPFYGLLDGGKDGQMFAELENYFYYAQLRSQGINTTEEREVSRVVPLEQVPFIMRALGYYPSEQEVEDMINEVKFSQYVETGQYVTEIDLPNIIKLYVNHRPAFGLSPDDLYHAFEVLGVASAGEEPNIDRSHLLSILQRKGEHMTEHELADCLATLLGQYPEGGSIEHGENLDHEEASRDLENTLPETITPSLFASEVLGLNLYEKPE